MLFVVHVVSIVNNVRDYNNNDLRIKSKINHKISFDLKWKIKIQKSFPRTKIIILLLLYKYIFYIKCVDLTNKNDIKYNMIAGTKAYKTKWPNKFEPSGKAIRVCIHIIHLYIYIYFFNFSFFLSEDLYLLSEYDIHFYRAVVNTKVWLWIT